ncbi:MAG: hypothetical protein ACLPKI_13915 [Streptosporangiaceae bacterium]
MTVWLFGQGALPGVLKAGADPEWLHGAYTLQRNASVRADVENVPVYNFKSLAACEAAPPPGFSWALYSQDSTSENSLWEMTHTSQAHERACELLHARGLKVITFPANDIVWKAPPVPDRDQYQAFITRHIPSDAARHADAVGVQSQGLTADAAAFAMYIRRARDQVRSACPGITFFGGLATERLGTLISAEQMHAAYAATSDICDGYWLNVNRRPEVAAELLRLVYS